MGHMRIRAVNEVCLPAAVAAAILAFAFLGDDDDADDKRSAVAVGCAPSFSSPSHASSSAASLSVSKSTLSSWSTLSAECRAVFAFASKSATLIRGVADADSGTDASPFVAALEADEDDETAVADARDDLKEDAGGDKGTGWLSAW